MAQPHMMELAGVERLVRTDRPTIQPSRTPPPGLPFAPASEPGSGESNRLLQALSYHWFLILFLGTVLGMAAAAAVWYLVPQRYTCYALLHVDAAEQKILNLGGNPNPISNEFPTYLKTQSDLIRSQFVLVAALRPKRIASLPTFRNLRNTDPIKLLEEELKVENAAGSQVLRISMAGERPEDIVQIVNAVQDAYLNEVVEEEQRRKQKHYADLEAVCKKQEDELKKLLDDLRAREETELGGSTGVSVKEKIALAALPGLVDRRNKYRLDRETYAARLKQLEAQRDAAEKLPELEAEFEQLFERDPEAQRLRTSLSKARRLHENLTRLYGPTQRDVVLAQRELANLQQQYDDYRQQALHQFNNTVRGRVRAKFEQEMRQLAEEIKILESQEVLLTNEINNHPEQIAKANKLTVATTQLAEKIEQRKKVLNALTNQMQAAKLATEAAPRVRKLQEASNPIPLNPKKKILLVVAAGLAGYLIIAGLVVGFEMLRGRVYGQADLQSAVPLPVLGCVPPCPAGLEAVQKTRRVSVVATRQRERFLESIDKLRAVTLNHFATEKIKTILISSASDSEGKTLLATHFALSLMHAEKRTLLIDCNLRNPRVHEYFGMPAKPGLCEVLRGEIPVADTILRAGSNGLSFIPAGVWDRQVKEELAKDKFRRLLDKLAQEYDFIVLDSHAVLSVADTLLICQHADAVMLAVMKYVSRVAAVREAVQKLVSVGSSQPGLVLMGEPAADVSPLTSPPV